MNKLIALLATVAFALPAFGQIPAPIPFPSPLPSAAPEPSAPEVLDQAPTEYQWKRSAILVVIRTVDNKVGHTDVTFIQTADGKRVLLNAGENWVALKTTSRELPLLVAAFQKLITPDFIITGARWVDELAPKETKDAKDEKDYVGGGKDFKEEVAPTTASPLPPLPLPPNYEFIPVPSIPHTSE